MNTSRISVLFDGHCGLCRRSVRWLRALDWRGRLRFVDFQNEEERRSCAPDIPYEELDRALHIRFPSGKTLNGFSAFRALCWYLPLLWPIIPFLWLPGARLTGDGVYGCIAARRKRCTHERCDFS